MTRSVLALCALLLLTAGCGGTSTADRAPTGRRSPALTAGDAGRTVDGVDLEVTGRQAPEPAIGTGRPPVTRVTGADSGLLISYTLRNRRDAPVLVVDRLPARGATMRLQDAPDPLKAQLRLGPDEQLDVVKAAGSGASGLDYTPYTQASVVAPGATHTGRAFVPFPADRYDRPEPFPYAATSWRLCLGVRTDAGGVDGRSVDGRVALVPADSDGESLVCSEPAPLPDDWT